MNKYLAVATINIKEALVFRAGLCLRFLELVLKLVILFYFWQSIYLKAESWNGYTFQELSVYIISAMVVSLVLSDNVISAMSKRIRDGSIAYDLMRPLEIQMIFLFSELGKLVFRVIFLVPPLVLCGIFLLDFAPALTVPRLGLFFVSAVFAFLISFFLTYFFALLNIVTINSWGLKLLYFSLTSLLAGHLMPLEFFPRWLMKLAHLLPFKGTIYIPVCIVTRDFNAAWLAQAVLFQATWVVVLFLLTRYTFNLVKQKLVILGG